MRIETVENEEKSTFSIILTRGTQKAHEEKRRKKFIFTEMFPCVENLEHLCQIVELIEINK